jgi:hypothetical protein
MAQTWYVIRGDTETQISGGTLSYRVSASNIGAPPKRNISVRGPFQQGETFYSFRYEKRIMTLAFHAVTSSLALADARRDDIYNLWKGIEGETVTLKVVRDDGAVRLIDGEVVNMIDFPESIYERFGPTQSFAVQLECHNPFWRKETTAVTSLTVNDTTIIPYAGQFPAEPIINIIGPITNPVVTQVYTGKKLDFTGTTIGANNNYQIDTRYGYKTVLDGSAVNQIAKLTNDSDLADFNINDFRSRVDGIVWQTHLSAEQNLWQSVAYGNGVWIAVARNGTNRVMRSTNGGMTWTAIAAAEQNSWRSVAYGNGVWVAVSGDGTNQVMRSTNDGVTWTAIAAAEQNLWQSVAYGNGVWIAVADMEFFGTQAIMRSTNNGVTWASISAPSNNSNWKSVAYVNNTWVAVSGRYPIPIVNQVMRSTNDGVTWTSVAAAEQNFWQSVAYGNGVWVAIAYAGGLINEKLVMRSTNDGVTWTAIAAAEQNSWRSVVYGNGVWVAVASDGTNRVMRSADDGATWTAIAAAEQNAWQSVAYGNNVWIAVASDGTNRVMRSADVSRDYTVTGTSTTSATSVTMTYNELYLGI